MAAKRTAPSVTNSDMQGPSKREPIAVGPLSVWGLHPIRLAGRLLANVRRRPCDAGGPTGSLFYVLWRI